VTKGSQEELLSMEVTDERFQRRIHGLMSDVVYVMSVCAVTSVGHGSAFTISAATRSPSCQLVFCFA